MCPPLSQTLGQEASKYLETVLLPSESLLGRVDRGTTLLTGGQLRSVARPVLVGLCQPVQAH
jgi:hypothetical protein